MPRGLTSTTVVKLKVLAYCKQQDANLAVGGGRPVAGGRVKNFAAILGLLAPFLTCPFLTGGSSEK